MAGVDSIFRTRSLGVAAAGLPDQYADGKAAKVWELYTGAKQERTKMYRSWITEALRMRNCKRVLDVACGTGVDSIMLVEEGFEVYSTDASDKMLKNALKERWQRRNEEAFSNWVIEEANWLTLPEDLEAIEEFPDDGFDAVICLGNSFAHLPDFEGKQQEQREAIANFCRVLKPGGVLIIDHRNYDAILDTGKAPPGKNVYYPSSHIRDIKTSNLYVDGEPFMVTLDYTMDITAIMSKTQIKNLPRLTDEEQTQLKTQKFRLSYYPHRLKNFTQILDDTFGSQSIHKVYGDFEEIRPDYVPAYFMHIIQKAMN